jgi:uncharacterized RDD family membrane protein YckC
MQCPACRAVYSNGLDNCPRCKTPATVTVPDIKAELYPSPDQATATASVDAGKGAQAASAGASTLIEFPGARSMPQWRKQLSERVREIQERRAREAAREVEEDSAPTAPLAAPASPEINSPPLGLVPPPPAQEMNPIVVAALRRIERARQTQSIPPVSRSRGGSAAAVARIAEEHYQEEVNSMLVAPQTEMAPAAKPAEAAPARNLVVVPAPVKEVPAVKPEPERAVEPSMEEEAHARLESGDTFEFLREDVFDDRAPVVARLTASAIDFLVVAFASSPFAAVIELTNGNWSDPRVTGSMGAIVLVVMFLYLTASTALAGRTWGMSLLSLRAVDADTGLQPTTKQAILRGLFYMLSLAALGLGVIYALFDAEGRTAHDHFSGTAVVQE